MDTFMSLSTSETSKTSKLNFKESLVLVAANGKTLKKRRLSLNQFITNDDLEAIANDPEEGKGSSAIISLFSIFKQMEIKPRIRVTRGQPGISLVTIRKEN